MENLKQSFVYKSVRKTYRKARKTVLDKGKSIESSFIGYLESEVAPIISVAQFSSVDVEHQYYAKIASLKNIYAMLVELEKNNPFLSDQEKAHKLVAIGKVIANEYLNTELRYFLAFLALNMYEDALTFSGLFWSCIHSNRHEESAKALNHFSLSDAADIQQIESLKQALATRLPEENIDQYLRKFDQSSHYVKKRKLKNELSNRESEYIELAKKQDFKALADIVFNKFNDNSDISDVLDFINLEFKINQKLPTKTILLILINIGKKFSEHGNRDFEISLIEEALKIKKNTTTVRAAFWIYYRQGSITKSRKALDWLEDYARSTGDKKQLEFVKAKKKLYLFIDKDTLVKLINDSVKNPIKDFNPIPNSIAYVLHNTLPYASGGYATRGHGLASAIQDKGMVVNVIGRPGFPLDIRKELKPSDVETIQVIEEVKYEFILSPRRDGTATLEYIIESSEQLFNKFLELRPSLIIAASNHLTALPTLIAARKLGIPFIYEVRGFWEITRISREPEFEATEFYKVLCDLEALAATHADHVFTLTTPMAEELVKRGVSKERLTLLPNSCNPERFEPVERDRDLAEALEIPPVVPVIGYIGTFVQYEGLEHLAEACGILKHRGVEFRLLIVGNENTAGSEKGSIAKSILEIAKQYDFEKWLIMPGRVPHEEVEAYYSLVDIAPFPRKPQPVTEMVSPMKPLEAAAMKKAIVVSSVRALTDMITDGENGLIFEKGDVEDLADKLFELIENETLRYQLGEKARLWVEEERTWEKVASIFINKINQGFSK